jgi:hypothetical protein
MPALKSVAQSAAKGAVSSLLSKVDYGSIGRGARDFYTGFSAKGTQPKSVSFSGPSIMDGMSSAPVAVSNRFVSRKASIRSGKGRKPTIIKHRELINGNILGSTTLTKQLTLALNPGNSTTFPWLSKQAIQYEEYHFRRLMFEYVPIVSTATQGDILLVPDYDSSNPPPNSEAEAIDHVDATIDSIWKPLSVVLSPRDMHALGPRKYVKPSANVFGDIKTFDCGNLHVFTNNELSNATIGKLFVHYEVELYTPFNGPFYSTQPSQVSLFRSSISTSYTTGIETLVNFDTVQYNPLAIVVASGAQFTPPPGVYKVTVNVTVQDAINENLSVVLRLKQDNALLWTGDETQADSATTTSVLPMVSLSWSNIFAVNGANVITATVVCTGAAGVLSSQAGKCLIQFELV